MAHTANVGPEDLPESKSRNIKSVTGSNHGTPLKQLKQRKGA